MECRIVDGFHETISERVQGGPERLNFITNRDMFLNGGIDRPIINERTARGSGKSLGRSIIVSRPNFGDLAQTAGDRALMAFRAGLCVIDWPKSLIDGFPLPEVALPQEALIKGDRRSASIMAGGIIAKTVRDAYMRCQAEVYPGYGFDSHFGYSTPEHARALTELGPCPLHRRSFSPVAVAEEVLRDGDSDSLFEDRTTDM